MNFEFEEWRKLYVRNTARVANMSWEARCILWDVLRTIDRLGRLDVGKYPTRTLSNILRIPLDVVERVLPEWLAGDDDDPPTLVLEGRTLVWPRFGEGQQAVMANTLRQRLWRERAKSENNESSTNNNDSSQEHNDSSTKRNAVETRRNATEQVRNACEQNRDDMNRDEKEKDMSSSRGSPDVALVFEHWVKVRASKGKKGRTMLTKDRQRVIKARLAEGHSIEDLQAAAEGIFYSPFHRGENDRKTEYLDIALALRDASHVEQFAALTRKRGNASGPRLIAPLRIVPPTQAELDICNEIAKGKVM